MGYENMINLQTNLIDNWKETFTSVTRHRWLQLHRSNSFCQSSWLSNSGVSVGDVLPTRYSIIYEPLHDKTSKMSYAPSKDSDQPGHLPSLISLRCVLIR